MTTKQWSQHSEESSVNVTASSDLAPPRPLVGAEQLAEGDLKWAARSTRPDTVTERRISALIRHLGLWPHRGFAVDWWPGDYKRLTLTFRLDSNARLNMVLESFAVEGVVRVAAFVTTKTGRVRRLSRTWAAPLMTLGFARVYKSLAVGILGFPDRYRDIAKWTLLIAEDGFNAKGPVSISYCLEFASRLDQMGVFQNIRRLELRSILDQSDYICAPDDRISDEDDRIDVIGPRSFQIRLLEPENESYLAFECSRALQCSMSPRDINSVNSQLVVGNLVVDSNRHLLFRLRISVTGGMSHASVRNRIDEWDAALAHVLKTVRAAKSRRRRSDNVV